jgi:hypothetical protein
MRTNGQTHNRTNIYSIFRDKLSLHGSLYYKLLFLVKSSSSVDHVWFSFFKGMHRYAAIVASLVCSKFNQPTNELSPGSLTLDDFRNEGGMKSFKDPGTTIAEHLDLIMTKKFEAPMFDNQFKLSA